MKNKRLIILGLGLSSVGLLLILLLFCNNKRNMIADRSGDSYSFYYRDTLDINKLFPDLVKYDVIASNNKLTRLGRRFFFENPEEITIDDININLIFEHGQDSMTRIVKVRCWKENGFHIEETTPFPLLSSSILFRLYKVIHRHLFNYGYYSAASLGDSLFLFNRGQVSLITSQRKYNVGSMIIDNPIYIQLLRGGDNLYLRNNNRIYITDNDFATSKLIYDDRRGIKHSMYWDEAKNKLVFSMYTPGSIRLRHYLLQYDPITDELDTLQTFYTTKEHLEKGFEPFCRHIHLIDKDPYTKDLFIGVGDYNGEAGIFRSKDGGQTIEKIGQGSQLWRTLAFFFTKDFIFWTNDSESPQYINRISRSQVENVPIDSTEVARFPMYNSAIWCNNVEKDGIYYVGSNCEGQYYDTSHRIYGITFSDDGIPTVYSVICENSIPENNYGIKYHQIFPMAIQKDIFYAYDTQLGLRTFKIKKINN